MQVDLILIFDFNGDYVLIRYSAIEGYIVGSEFKQLIDFQEPTQCRVARWNAELVWKAFQ
jgi:hypothetical protein